jgi:hypothetical protein
VLVVSPEEKADRIHPIELRDARFRNSPTTDAENAVSGRIYRQTYWHNRWPPGRYSSAHRAQRYGRTPVGTTRLVGRMNEMSQVHSLLHAGDVAQVSYAVSAGGIGRVNGLGSVGKSLLVEEYALHFGAGFPGGVFWLLRRWRGLQALGKVGPVLAGAGGEGAVVRMLASAARALCVKAMQGGQPRRSHTQAGQKSAWRTRSPSLVRIQRRQIRGLDRHLPPLPT